MFLDRNDLEAMKLFNDKAEKLNGNSFTKKIISEGFGITISGKKGEPISIEKRLPTNEEIESFVLTIRFFIQDNEASSFRNLSVIYSKLPSQNKEKNEFLNARKELNNYLDSPDKSLNINENGKILSNREIFDTILYGGLAHAQNVSKRKKFEEWMTNPIMGPILEAEFVNILSNILHIVLYVQEINESLIIDFSHFKL